MEKQSDKAEQFVAYILGRCATDNGFAARLRRADNPDTEYQSYEILSPFGINIEHDHERLPYCLIGAALARAKMEHDGTASLGKALKSCYEDGAQGDIRLRRLLACTTLEELCRILRPILSLLESKSKQTLSYARLLREMTFFFHDTKRIKLRWAQDYYGKPEFSEQRAPSSADSQSAKSTPHTDAIQLDLLLSEEK